MRQHIRAVSGSGSCDLDAVVIQTTPEAAEGGICWARSVSSDRFRVLYILRLADKKHLTTDLRAANYGRQCVLLSVDSDGAHAPLTMALFSLLYQLSRDPL
ncbi:hypothetical protein J6590_007645 [Homalodisca vitripennis]|nr:hypothetical protein J6590_007645 [Homalodisca vitripennis]